jgi:hypothetical protein
MLKVKTIFAAVFFLALAASCGSPSATTSSTASTTGQMPPVTTVRLSADVQPIFNASCVVCHQGSSAPGGMSLESGKAYAALVNVKSSESPLMRVAPNSPDNSYVVRKLEGTHIQAGGSGGKMPLNGSPLPAAQIDIIKRWISLGAPNN